MIFLSYHNRIERKYVNQNNHKQLAMIQDLQTLQKLKKIIAILILNLCCIYVM